MKYIAIAFFIMFIAGVVTGNFAGAFWGLFMTGFTIYGDAQLRKRATSCDDCSTKHMSSTTVDGVSVSEA